MKHIAIAAFAAVIGFGMMVQNAEARRLGGARSSGISRDSSIMQRSAAPTSTPAKTATPTQAAAPTASNATPPAKPEMSRWLGPLAGLAAGIGLASLFSHLGMGEGMGNMVMMIALGLLVVFLVRRFMTRRQTSPSAQYAAAGHASPMRFESLPTGSASHAAGAGASATAIQLPADFDVDSFLRQAKLNFVRLQAANDRGDMDDIRQFTSPEMFAEVQLDYQDRGRKTQQTDVIELNADLLDVTVEAGHQLASVRFHGQLREEADAMPEAFSEAWHLSKSNDGSRAWTVVGIQQA